MSLFISLILGMAMWASALQIGLRDSTCQLALAHVT
ncbi:hypothetical protein GLYMA_13G113850v4 [Glycine max]|nr:hypothetical protein GLYMA_13G113850v4 [Glycine max]KAH1100930.1 hypothetical protein GYH30_035863 [Glycine max]